jgi:hypothetical protein
MTSLVIVYIMISIFGYLFTLISVRVISLNQLPVNCTKGIASNSPS